MAKFDTFYDKQCAKIWSLPRIENPTYRINKPSWKGGRFDVMEVHIGWAHRVGSSFATLEEAEQYMKELSA